MESETQNREGAGGAGLTHRQAREIELEEVEATGRYVREINAGLKALVPRVRGLRVSRAWRRPGQSRKLRRVALTVDGGAPNLTANERVRLGLLGTQKGVMIEA